LLWTCSRCGAEHEGVPLDWAFDKPAYWDGKRHKGDWLSDDLCVWTDDAREQNYFIRGVLYVPILETGEAIGYGVWSSLSETSFNRIYDLWDDQARTEEPPYFGWLSNSLVGYPETLNLALDVITEELEKRPSFVLHDGDHPLIDEQRHGISQERVLEIAELNMHAD
jgi:hypothetical protein